MTRRSQARVDANATFTDAIEEATHLRFLPGLQAIKQGEGKGQVSGKSATNILGSVAIDDDCRAAYPTASRWDYAIGYSRSNEAIAYFVEVHSAETSEVSTVERKLLWLKGFLAEQSQRKLADLSAEYHWVASGRINIPHHTPQFRKLKTTLFKMGLRGPVRSLEMT